MTNESQKQRWIKYGLNVALSIVVVIVLAGIVCYLAQRHSRRADMTISRSYSLKPQTLNVLGNLKQKITLVSLYPRTKEAGQQEELYQPVVDLLEEYSRHSKNVEIDAIDPHEERGKLEQLIDKVASKYGAEVKKYQDFLNDFPKTLAQVKEFATAEQKQLAKVPFDKMQDRDLQQTLLLTVVTVQQFPQLLQETQEKIDQVKKQKLPNYKGAADEVRSKLDSLSQMLGQIVTDFKSAQDDKRVPEEIRSYIAGSLTKYESTKKLADDQIKRIDSLGELKLDTLRESLRQENSILVMGEKDIKVLPFSSVWKTPDTKQIDPEATVRMQFAGEQQISTAIMQLTMPTKLKICFVRPGGQPLVTSMMGQSAPLSEIADRLKDLGFDVTEKDLSGQWEMQAQMQQMPAAPEPSEDQIKDAIWVVLDFAPAMGRQGPSPLAPKLAEHLKQGGSALVLANPQADNLEAALKSWGVTLNTDAIATHEMIHSNGAQSSDAFEEAQRYPFIFLTSDYGNHPIGSPLKSLEALLSPMVPVSVTAEKGFTASPLLPVPRNVKTWGSRDVEKVLNGEEVKAGPNDLPNTDSQPLYCGAAVEKQGEGRLVVIGSLQFLVNRFLTMPDYDLLKKQHRLVARFPGNSELMTNACWWLAKMDTMMAISPAAMQVSRIGPMSDRAQEFWKLGVLVIGLPSLVLLAGAMVYVKRRD